MALLNEPIRPSDVLLFESDKFNNYNRDEITLLSGGNACVVGQVLGQITAGAATSAAKSGGNTGNGTLVLDATTPVLAGATAGIYTARVTVAGTNLATFLVVDPKGVSLGTASFSGSGATFTFADRLKFVVTDGGTDFVVGDGFDITVAAGSGKWVQVAPSANDGSQIAAGVCLEATTTAQGTPTLTGDTKSVALTRGPAAVKSGGLTWTSGMSDPQKATALAQLLAIGIKSVTDYGV